MEEKIQEKYQNNFQIFKFINKYSNDNFSKFNMSDLNQLLYYLAQYYLEYRERLNFDNSVTFGLELEFEKSNTNEIIENLKIENLYSDWIIKGDTSIKDGNEINSPILTDTNLSWENLERVCSIVKNNAVIGDNSGGHIHLGTQILGDKVESWLNFIKLWSVYENIIYRFSYGERLTARPFIEKHAPPAANYFLYDYETFKTEGERSGLDIVIDFLKLYCKNNAVNFDNITNYTKLEERNTIEFRCPNGTLEPVIWQNNVNLFVSLLLYSKNSKFNYDIIEKRMLINKHLYDCFDTKKLLFAYEKVYLDQALELADLVFNTNYDKIYFLKQYIKSFDVIDNSFKKTKILIKK